MWSEAIVFICGFHVFRAVFNTIVVSLCCSLCVIAILFLCFFDNKDRYIADESQYYLADC